jgi:uncharacterized protein YndB with AHSA1/START domain
MARNETYIEATPERVFEVLADPDCYGYWVVGSKHIRDADPDFPKPGSRFHHTVGVGPLTLNDHTEVIAADPPRRLELKAKARPLGTAHVKLHLTPEHAGTRVTMIEDPGDSLTALIFLPLTHVLVRLRNLESLRRLKRLAERRPR